ncbi:hypothetical protein FACS1894111_01890 [Clostridia bacterium]|nr:hypothetical protein FACS1894111_01890 [Clostridia bacterium]
MSDFGLRKEVTEQIIAVLSRYPQIERGVIFGSRAKGNYKQYSDIDLCLFGEIDVWKAEEVRMDLEELDVIYTFDVLAFETISNEALREHIETVGIEIYKVA